MKYIGVDGCKKGWFYVCLDEHDKWITDVIPDIRYLTDKIHEDSLILIDIPIGLHEKGTHDRLCDIEARKILGKRRSSVFPVPCRKAVYYTKKYLEKFIPKFVFTVSMAAKA